jgi:hypothetical protein
MGVRGRKSRDEVAADHFLALSRPPKRVERKVAPSHLRKEGAAFFASMVDRHGIDDPRRLALLEKASECLDTIAAARAAMAKTGPVILNQYDIAKAHPAITIEKQARDGFFAALRLLDVDAGGSADDPPPWARAGS